MSLIKINKKAIKIALIIFIMFQILFYFHFLITNLKRAPWWDESIYLLMGKYFISFGKYGYFEIFRPILWPLLLSPFSLSHHAFIIMQIISFLFVIFNVFLLYFVLNKIFNYFISLLAIILLLFFPTFYEFSIIGLTFHLAIFLTLISILFYLKGYKKIAVVFSALAFLSRYPFGILFFSIIANELFILFKKSSVNKKSKNLYIQIKNIIYYFIIFFVSILPLLIFLKIKTKSFFGAFVSAMEVVPKNAHVLPFFSYSINLFEYAPYIIFSLFGIFFFIKLTKNFEKLIIVWFSVFYFMFFSFFVNHVEIRYILPSLIFLIPLALFAMLHLFSYINVKSKKNKVRFRALYVVILIVGIILIIGLIIVPIINVRFIYLYKFENDGYLPIIPYLINRSVVFSTEPMPLVFTNNRDFFLASYYSALKIISVHDGTNKLLFFNNCSYFCNKKDISCLKEKSFFNKYLSKQRIIKKIKLKHCSYVLYQLISDKDTTK